MVANFNFSDYELMESVDRLEPYFDFYDVEDYISNDTLKSKPNYFWVRPTLFFNRTCEDRGITKFGLTNLVKFYNS